MNFGRMPLESGFAGTIAIIERLELERIARLGMDRPDMKIIGLPSRWSLEP